MFIRFASSEVDEHSHVSAGLFSVEEKWRRGQDSNLDALSGGGFQDLKGTLNLILPPTDFPIKMGLAAVRVIQVRVGGNSP
jgi:hypothetical protein